MIRVLLEWRPATAELRRLEQSMFNVIQGFAGPGLGADIRRATIPSPKVIRAAADRRS
jgi:hypothetical protein